MLILTSCGSLLTSSGAEAVDLSRRVQFDIPAQSLSTALLRFSEQAAVQLAAPSTLLRDLQTDGVRGEHPMNVALQTLLRGTSLTFEALDERTVAIRKGKIGARTAASASAAAKIGQEYAGGANGHETLGASASLPADVDKNEEEGGQLAEGLLGEVVVTGSHIRGVSPDSSPLTFRAAVDAVVERGVADPTKLGFVAFSRTGLPAVRLLADYADLFAAVTLAAYEDPDPANAAQYERGRRLRELDNESKNSRALVR